jgi:phytoene desaturase
MGGMNQIVQAMVKIATGNGARLMLNHEVKRIETQTGKAKHVHTDSGVFEADVVIAGSDYHHTEQKLLREDSRVYNNEYWNSRTMSPSSLLFFVGVNRRVEGLLHHNLFFDADFELHANQIYNKPQWPTAPLFYACAPSKTDNTVAPDGMENIFLLMPIAPGIKDTDEMREKYYHMMMERLEQRAGQAVRPHVVVKRSYCVNDFEADYHSFKGNAYGLANTLMQTAFMKPKMRSEKVKNLFYTGQLTVPGPGVPPAIISGQIAAREVSRQIEKQLI